MKHGHPSSTSTLSIDLGGSWVRLRGASSDGQITLRYKDKAPALKDLPSRLRRLWKQWSLRPVQLCIASRGVWTPHERQRLAASLRNLAHHVMVMSDVEAAWLGAFGTGAEQGMQNAEEGVLQKKNLLPHSALHTPHSGIIVIAGTGSIAFGRYRGRAARAGGLGPYLGDEGSGFWIGREWLKHQARTTSGRSRTLEFLHRLHAPVREIAALAPSVMLRTRRGNRLARRIISEAQDHLAGTAFEVALSLRWKGPLTVSWAGSLLENPWFRTGFKRALRRCGRTHRMSVSLIDPQREPVDALLHYGRH